jgi:hypothetical protein
MTAAVDRSGARWLLPPAPIAGRYHRLLSLAATTGSYR